MLECLSPANFSDYFQKSVFGHQPAHTVFKVLQSGCPTITNFSLAFKRLNNDKHSSLFCLTVSDGEKEFYEIVHLVTLSLAVDVI
jgi:hypothetical protein